MKHYTAQELEAMPTISVGQADNLKVEEDGLRIWLSRCTVEDGEPYNNKVSVEQFIDDRWQVVTEYEG